MKEMKKPVKQQNGKISRRDFLGAAAAVAAFTIVPRHVLGGPGYTPPSEKLNIAGIGLGGQGSRDIERVGSENIVALCDVDDQFAAGVFNTYPNARKYRDFRKMLEKEKDIDAVVIATPDHTHALIAMTAIRMGKHVYCEKPLAHSIYEVRRLTEAARKHNVVTQMGIQCHADESIRLLCEWIWAGAIGPVREVHLWSNKPISSHAINRPKQTPPVPSTLDWDLWLGPAPERPYHSAYHPFKWRYWWDFGTGRLGDMACHIMDPAFWALKLTSPVTVEAQTTKFNDEVYPDTAVVRYEFAARDKLPPVTVTWYHGGIYPWRPEELEQGRNFPAEGGLYIGEKGKILIPHIAGPRLIPEEKMKSFNRPKPSLSRCDVGHYQQWVLACKGKSKTLANFDYAGPLTEAVLLGNVAVRAGNILHWDGPNMKVTNVPEANQYLSRQYRQGWTL
ncbi:MAG: Gfo/Idh/MocA family oxidoreductase [Sedimentisphaerales bacterium]|nr:Gfo/Idh/MocA family oxidoreductase [Sedimentisphaerales bacterium]